MIDWNLIFAYGLIFFFSICLIAMTSLLAIALIKLIKTNKKISEKYLENLIPGIIGGIIAFILLETRGDGWKTFNFYARELWINLCLIFIFIILGFVYLYGIDKLFEVLEKKKQ